MSGVASRGARRRVRLLACGAALLLLPGVAYLLTGRAVRSGAADTVREAELALRRGDNAQARERLQWLLWFEPEHDRALLIAGISLNADRRFPEAVALLERIPAGSSSSGQAEIALASSLEMDGQWDRAEAVLRQHLARLPGSRDACDRLVRLYLKEFRQREALALLNDYRRTAPDDLSVLPDILELQVKKATPHERLAALEAAHDRHPGQFPVVLGLARVHALMGHVEDAQCYFDLALQSMPDDLVVRLLAAEFRLDNGDFESAAMLLSPVAEDFREPVYADRYWRLRARLAEHSGNLMEADEFLRRALALRPNDESLLLLHAALLRRQGQTDAAAAAARRASQIAQTRLELMILRDDLQLEQIDPNQCRDIAQLLERIDEASLAEGWRRLAEAATPATPPNPFLPVDRSPAATE